MTPLSADLIHPVTWSLMLIPTDSCCGVALASWVPLMLPDWLAPIACVYFRISATRNPCLLAMSRGYNPSFV